MRLRPVTPEDLAASLRAAHATSTRIEGIDLAGLARILEHTPEDMTVTVQAGCTLAVLQQALANRGQWLPIDPPHPDRLTIAGLLDANASGPRRCGHGTIREHLIGLRVALADGRLIRSGGKVVKNVAGYDLMKLFIGAQGTLGVIVEATFKLLPRPEAEALVEARFDRLEPVEASLNAIFDSALTPTVLDLHNIQTPADAQTYALVLGFSGARAAVDWQLDLAAGLGAGRPASLEYDAAFQAPGLPAPHRRSVLPSRLFEALHGLGDEPFVARAAQGILLHRPRPASSRIDSTDGRSPEPTISAPALELMRRVKNTFDPRRVFPEMPW